MMLPEILMLLLIFFGIPGLGFGCYILGKKLHWWDRQHDYVSSKYPGRDSDYERNDDDYGDSGIA